MTNFVVQSFWTITITDDFPTIWLISPKKCQSDLQNSVPGTTLPLADSCQTSGSLHVVTRSGPSSHNQPTNHHHQQIAVIAGLPPAPEWHTNGGVPSAARNAGSSSGVPFAARNGSGGALAVLSPVSLAESYGRGRSAHCWNGGGSLDYLDDVCVHVDR